MARKRKKILLENITVADAGAKGKAVTRLDNGLVVFIEGAVPGDVCDVLVHKKRKSFMEGRPVKFHSYSDLEEKLFANTSACVEDVNGSLWIISTSYTLSKKKLKIL